LSRSSLLGFIVEAQHRRRSVENRAAFSTWRLGARRALTPTLSQGERGLFERALGFIGY